MQSSTWIAEIDNTVVLLKRVALALACHLLSTLYNITPLEPLSGIIEPKLAAARGLSEP